MASGSSDLHLRMDNVGVPNCFVSYPGNERVGYLNYDTENAFGAVARFCADIVCDAEPSCGQLSTDIVEMQAQQGALIGPNPTTGRVTVQVQEPAVLELCDLTGRVVHTSPGSCAFVGGRPLRGIAGCVPAAIRGRDHRPGTHRPGGSLSCS
ncbi:MAG: hypothetical protein U0U25_03755 [Flavobacteriales bacterium]